MYKLELRRKVEKDIKKLEKSGINLSQLKRNLEKLQSNPYKVSEAKSGNLGSCRATEWGDGCRIVFEIFEDEKVVLVTSIDSSHDEAYKKAKRRKKK